MNWKMPDTQQNENKHRTHLQHMVKKTWITREEDDSATQPQAPQDVAETDTNTEDAETTNQPGGKIRNR